jgi:hypothetical protein
MKFSIRKAAGALALAGMAAVLLPMALAPSVGAAPVTPDIYAVDTTGHVLTLTPNLNNNPATIVASYTITGMVDGDTAVGIDRRQADGELWIVGKGASSTHLYTVDPYNGVATPKAELRNVNAAYAPVVLSGTLFGTDIDPTTDTMRIVSNTQQNLHVFMVAVAGPTFRNPGDTIIDTNLSITGIQGAAYAGVPTGAQLYTVSQRKLYTQNGNAGVETFVANLASFGNSFTGFDIVDNGDGYTGYYSRGLATNSSVYTLNLTTGATNRLLTTPTGTVLREIAVDQPYSCASLC